MALPQPSDDRTALVTGASSGLGVHFATQLASAGQHVTLVARREDRLNQVAEDILAATGITPLVVTADLSDLESRSRVAEQVASSGRWVSILVNNAGLSTSGPVAASDPEAEVTMIRTDVEAVAHLCSTFVPPMVENRTGAILNVASTAAFQPLPGQAGYAASKAFVLSYTHALRSELSGTGVAVTTLCPGPVETEFGEQAGFTEEETHLAALRYLYVSPESVTSQGLAGLAGGRAVVIPGVGNKVSAWSGWAIPRRVLLPLLRSQHPAMQRGA
jgi:short-subunit dehydrogenase